MAGTPCEAHQYPSPGGAPSSSQSHCSPQRPSASFSGSRHGVTSRPLKGTSAKQYQIVDQKTLTNLSRQLTSEWKCIARELRLSNGDIHSIEFNNRSHIEEAKFEILRRWREQNGNNATYGVLASALCTAGRCDLASDILSPDQQCQANEGTLPGDSGRGFIIVIFVLWSCTRSTDSSRMTEATEDSSRLPAMVEDTSLPGNGQMDGLPSSPPPGGVDRRSAKPPRRSRPKKGRRM